VPSLSRDDLYEVRLRLPPRGEQDGIVGLLEKLYDDIDAGVNAFRAGGDGCEQLRRAALAQLTDDAFPRKRIGELAEVFVGATPSRKDSELWNGPIPWVSSGEVAFCRISETRETITEAGLGNSATRLHPPGTVLLAMIGEGKTRGQAAILDIPAAHNQNAASIRLDRTKMLPEFLYYTLMEQYERNRRVGSGSQQPALNGGLVRALEVPCPDIETQQALVLAVERSLADTHALASSLSTRRADAGTLRRSILHQAMTGQLLRRGSVGRENDRAVLVAE
jgi:type I restriction enzyme S subunit